MAASALTRADEPGEMLAYFVARYGRAVPTWLKRGINLALPRLYTERAVLKYDGGERRWRFGDVIALTHPKPQTAKAAALYRFLSLSRYGKGWEWLRGAENAQRLPMLASWDALNRLELPQRRALVAEGNTAVIGGAGITWERLSGWLQGPMDAAAWTLVIPSMGYMALLRNLRNFEDATMPEAAMQAVAEKLVNTDEVRASRQFPLRFYSAYKSLRSERFGRALETALELSVSNIPPVPGKTLIMVDCSGSMNSRLSRKTELLRWEAAALFGTALAKRCEQADLYAYSDTAQRIGFSGPTLRLLPGFMQWPGAGCGTRTWDATAACFKGHDRIVILTDEQAWPLGGSKRSAPPSTPAQTIYTWNLAGYSAAHNEQGKDSSYVFGGLTDAGFRMLSLLEAGQDTNWPFLER